MGTPVPKIKANFTVSPEFKRALVQTSQIDAVVASTSVAADVATLLVDLNATITKLNALVSNYNSLLAKLRLAGIIDS